jgi:hypothetical protein
MPLPPPGRQAGLIRSQGGHDVNPKNPPRADFGGRWCCARSAHAATKAGSKWRAARQAPRTPSKELAPKSASCCAGAGELEDARTKSCTKLTGAGSLTRVMDLARPGARGLCSVNRPGWVVSQSLHPPPQIGRHAVHSPSSPVHWWHRGSGQIAGSANWRGRKRRTADEQCVCALNQPLHRCRRRLPCGSTVVTAAETSGRRCCISRW